MVLTYKCPNCGGNMVYNAEANKLECSHCNSMFAISDINNIETKEENNKEFVDNTTFFHCPSCGAQLLTDNFTAATICPYCGSPSIIEDRIHDTYSPDSVIPFKFDKERTVSILKSWCKNGLFTPSDFLTDRSLEKLSGFYVPFWLYDFQTNTNLTAKCTKRKSYTSGDYDVVETSHYVCSRNQDAKFHNIPADASKKMEDNIMDLLEPFNYSELRPFEMSYLSGYSAEKYNFTYKDMLPRLEQRVNSYAKELCKDTIKGYSTVSVTNSNTSYLLTNADYSMFPVWIYNYHYKGADYRFTMNGQTGKIVGKPPVCTNKILLVFFMTTLGAMGFLVLLTLYLGGY